MVRNHPHWNTDDWEDPSNGLAPNDALLDNRDVELSTIGTIDPSGVTQEQLDAYKEAVKARPDSGGSIIGDINKELEMNPDTGKSDRVQRVETRITEHRDSISQLNDASWRAQKTADDAIADAAKANDELGDLLDQDTDNPLGLWRLQEAINEANEAALVAHQAAIEANTLAIEGLSRSVTRHLIPGSAIIASNEYVSTTADTITIKGDWVGSIVVLNTSYTNVSGGEGRYRQPGWNAYNIPLVNGEKSLAVPGSTAQAILINVRGGTAVNEKVTKQGMSTLPNNQWVTALEWVVKEDGPVYGSASFDWRNKTYVATYSARITLNGVAIHMTNSSAAAPIFGHARARHSLTFRGTNAKKGQVLKLEYLAQHDNPINREVDSEVINIAYVSPDSSS